MSCRSIVVAFAIAVSAAACHDESDVRVAGLAFRGNEAINAAELRTAMATRSGGQLPWSEKLPFDRAVFNRDLARLPRFYEDRGYPDARVRDVDVTLNSKQDAVTLTIEIAEGDPLPVHLVRITGLDELPEALQTQIVQRAPTVGAPRDRRQVVAFRQLAIDVLRNNGYAYGTASVDEVLTPQGADITLAAVVGPATVFGPIEIVGQERVSDRVIMRQVGLRPGQTYRLSRARQGQRRLASLDILEFASIDARPQGPTGPTAVPVTVTVSEAPPRRLDIGIGYGTEDRARGSISWAHLNFLGNASRLATDAKWSSIDRGVRVSLVEPYILRPGLSLEASASTWWTGQDIYTSATYGGEVALRYRIGAWRAALSRGQAESVRVAYMDGFVQAAIRPESLDDLSNVATRIALGLNPVTGATRGTRVGLAFDYERVRVDNTIDPRSGYGTTAHVERAFRALGGSYSYLEVNAQGHAYLPIGPIVLASRVRTGTIAAATDADVPFSRRYYLGGSASLRGWGRYEVAPLSDGTPIGGRTILDGTVEIRVPVRGSIGTVAFVDGGNVWAGSFAARALGLRGDVGVGVRYKTPMGLIRADIARQLDPVEGLLVDGEPEVRHWRIHFSIGQAF